MQCKRITKMVTCLSHWPTLSKAKSFSWSSVASMGGNLILNQHLAKNKTTFSRFTQHSVLTSHPLKGAGMAGLRDLNQAPQRLLLKKKNRIPCLPQQMPFTPGTGCQHKPKQISFILVQPQGAGALYSRQNFQSVHHPLLTISLQPGGQLILIDPNMFLLMADFYKPVRSLRFGLFPLALLINQVLMLAIKPASRDSPWLAMQPFSRWSLSSGAFKTSGSKNQTLGMTAHDMTLEEICFLFLWDVCCFRILRGTLSWLKESSGDESKEDGIKRFHYHCWQGVWVGGVESCLGSPLLSWVP